MSWKSRARTQGGDGDCGGMMRSSAWGSIHSGGWRQMSQADWRKLSGTPSRSARGALLVLLLLLPHGSAESVCESHRYNAEALLQPRHRADGAAP